MPDITITLTDEEYKALAWVAVDPVEWVTNFTKNRSAAAMQEIYVMEVQRMNSDPDITHIPADPAEVVRDADLTSAADRHAEFLANPPVVDLPPPAKETRMHGDPEVDPPITPVPPKPEPIPPQPEPDEDEDEDDDEAGGSEEKIA